MIPIGDNIPQGAAGLAEWNAAIHAARSLASDLVVGEREIYFLEITEPFCYGPALGQFALII
jgi:hypothetical protein